MKCRKESSSTTFISFIETFYNTTISVGVNDFLFSTTVYYCSAFCIASLRNNFRVINTVKTRNDNCKLAKKRIQKAKRKADNLKRASKSAITSSHIVTVGRRALPIKRRRLESSLLIASDQSLNKAETIIILFMQHYKCEKLDVESSRDANNGRFDTDPSNNVSNLSGERIESPIKSSNLEDEKAAHPLLSKNNLPR